MPRISRPLRPPTRPMYGGGINPNPIGTASGLTDAQQQTLTQGGFNLNPSTPTGNIAGQGGQPPMVLSGSAPANAVFKKGGSAQKANQKIDLKHCKVCTATPSKKSNW